MGDFELINFADADELARAAAKQWLDQIQADRQSDRPVTVAISGGRIAQKFFAEIVTQAKTSGNSLASVHFFWADERCVPPEDAESNYRLARELLLAPLAVAEDRIHRVKGELSPDDAAAKACQEVARIAPVNSDGQSVLDWIFLGMGEDGHVASLFPGEPEEVTASKAAYRAVRNSPKPPPDRVTLGYGAIAAARQVWVLISGAGKAGALRESVKSGGRTPLARVLAARSQTRVFSDILL